MYVRGCAKILRMTHIDENCIFCKIIKKEIPAHIIYEDEHTLALLDIKPVSPGHTLVIPKDHYENIFTAPEETLVRMIQTVKKVSHGIKDGLSIENMNISINNGADAGQVIFHSHIHLVPRSKGDGLKLWPGGAYKDGEAQKILEQIKNAL